LKLEPVKPPRNSEVDLSKKRDLILPPSGPSKDRSDSREGKWKSGDVSKDLSIQENIQENSIQMHIISTWGHAT
jgi:hypothetical protein